MSVKINSHGNAIWRLHYDKSTFLLCLNFINLNVNFNFTYVCVMIWKEWSINFAIWQQGVHIKLYQYVFSYIKLDHQLILMLRNYEKNVTLNTRARIFLKSINFFSTFIQVKSSVSMSRFLVWFFSYVYLLPPALNFKYNLRLYNSLTTSDKWGNRVRTRKLSNRVFYSD